ncbi:MAG: N-acetylmuramoyl-L-alanine amidase [Flavitalea sp.]
MVTLLTYLLKVMICSGILFSYYWFFLRNKQFHQYNRFYLIGAILLSWLIPFIKIDISKVGQSDNTNLIQLLNIVADKNTEIEMFGSGKNFLFNQENILLSLFSIVSIVLLTKFIRSILRIRKLINSYPVKNLHGLKLVLTDVSSAPFSFFRYIFWNTSIDLDSKVGKKILQHELVHSEEKHSADKMFIELSMVAGWFNPFFWLIRSELFMIHEFIADNKSISNGDASVLAEVLLTAAYPQQQHLLTNPFFFSPIKRRITMLTKNSNIKFSYLRRLSILPILTIIVSLFAFRLAEKTETVNSDLKKQYTIVIDAGHGGDDPGTSNGKDAEKELTLALSKKIMEMNTNKDIKIHLTRDRDEAVKLQDRTNKINTLGTDLMISIHVNGLENKEDAGLEFVIPNSSSKFHQQSLALASVINISTTPIFGSTKGVKVRDQGIWILSNSNCPSLLIEVGNLKNVKELSILKNRQEEIANSILKGINEYLSIQENSTQTLLLKPSLKKDSKDTLPSGKEYKVKVSGDSATFYDSKSGKKLYSVRASKLYPETKEEVVVVGYGKKKSTDQNSNNREPIELKLTPSEHKVELKKDENGELKEVQITGKPIISKVPDEVLYFIDGKKTDKKTVDALNTEMIEAINVYKDAKAIEKFGKDAGKGVIEIILKD